MISFVLNLPYTLCLFILGLTCQPKYIKLNQKPFAIVIKVKDFWWRGLVYKYSRAMASGNTVLLGPREEEHDLEHELIHVRQHNNLPFIHPFLNVYQNMRYGYRMNKYENEAYRLSGSVYRGKFKE